MHGKKETETLIYDVLFLSGSNVTAYVNMVCDTLRLSIPKAVVYCQVLQAKRSLLNQFYANVGRREVKLLKCYITWCTDLQYYSQAMHNP